MNKNKTTRYTMTIDVDVYDDVYIYTVDNLDIKMTDMITGTLLNLKPDYIQNVEWTSLKIKERDA